MHRKRRLIKTILAGLLAGAPGAAMAFTGVEGSLIGDQGFYWTTPGQTWIFPQTLHNIDNRVMLQVGSPPTALFNQLDIQNGRGGGFVLELADNFNVGMWVSEYTPGTGAFLGRAVTETGWDTFVGSGPGSETSQLSAHDPFEYFGLGTAPIEAGRKLDLFASYVLPELGLDTGLRFSYGSTHANVLLDDSTGPIDIDTDSDVGTGDAATGAETSDDVAEGKFKLTDMGLSLGAGYSGLENLRADVGLDFNLYGVNWEPGGVTDYVDAGGSAVAFNARAHYTMSDRWQVGAFVRFARTGMHLEPKKQRDGGDLVDFFDETNDGLPTPPASAPTGEAGDGNELTPVSGLKYEESAMNTQVAALARFTPNSNVKVYFATGFGFASQTTKLSVGEDWINEVTTSNATFPFFNIGFDGKVFENMDVLMGATKRWAGTSTQRYGFDVRIPSNNDGIGGVAPPPGQEDNTNENRGEVDEKEGRDITDTQFMVGTRLHYGPVQLIGQLDPNVLLRGPYLISGSTSNNPMWFWVNLAYDWDYDQDTTGGNGTITRGADVHQAPAPAPASSDS